MKKNQVRPFITLLAVFFTCMLQGASGYSVNANEVSALNFTQQQKLSSSTPQRDGFFGESVANWGEFVFVGAPTEDVGSVIDAGAVHVYRKTVAGVEFVQRLTSNSPSIGAGFGYSVGVHENTAVIGTSGEDAAYIFTNSGSWAQTNRLASPGAIGDNFGAAVAVFGNTIAVGAPGEWLVLNPQGVAGSIFVYTNSGVGWGGAPRRIFSPTAVSGDAFGAAIAIDGERILVGAPTIGALNDLIPGLLSSPGAAYSLVRNNNTWNHEGLLAPTDPENGNGFGLSVDLSSVYAVVGSPRKNSGFLNLTVDTGAAYTFLRSGSAWVQQSKLTGNNAADDNFGEAVTMFNDTVLVGAPFEDVNGTNDAGAVYPAFRSGANWVAQPKVTTADPGSNNFGEAVSLHLNQLVIGARRNTGFGLNAGAVYVFGAPLNAPPETNLLINGDFSQPLANSWTFYNALSQVSGGVLRVARQAGSAEGGFYQNLSYAVPGAAPVEISFSMSNTSNVAKSVGVHLRNAANWTGVQTCVFSLSAVQPLQYFTMRVVVPAAWPSLILQFALGEADSRLGLDIDNVTLRYRPGVFAANSCLVEPPPNTNLIYDGAFNFGFSSWAVFGNPFAQIVPVNSSNTFEIMRYVGSPTAPGVYQFNPYSLPAGGAVQLTLRLGNRSPQFKTLAVVLRNADWTNLNICYFGLAPNTPIQNQSQAYTMQVRPTVNWQNTVFQIYLLQADGAQAAQVDDVNLQYAPALTFIGSRRCFLPNGVEVTAADLQETPVETAAPPQTTGLIGDGGITPLQETGTSGEGGIVVSPQSVPADPAKP